MQAIDELGAVRGYDRAALEACLANLTAERDRLRSSVTAVEQRRDALVAAHPRSVTERLGAVVLDAQAQLTAEWDACRHDEAALEKATEAVASWVVVAAHSHARALKAVAARVRATGVDDASEVAERWWQGVVDLTDADTADSAHTA